MILLILGISIVILMLSLTVLCRFDEEIGDLLFGSGVVGIFISLIVIAILIINVSSNSKIDQIIAMYEEENEEIEIQIDALVEQYMKYESNTFKGCTPESAITLVSLYPELKSDELVSQQIKIYMANNEEIKHLKKKKIYASVYKWWLYFGK